MDVVPQLETCRICAKCYLPSSPADFLHIFQPKESIQHELEFIRNEINCWQLEISPNDGLPQKICSNCFQKFCNIKIFVEECSAAQMTLREARARKAKMQDHVKIQKDLAALHDLPTLAESDANKATEVSRLKVLEDKIVLEKVRKEKVELLETEIVATPRQAQYEVHNEITLDESKLFNEVVAQEADTTTQSSNEDLFKRNSLDDLEDLLEGSIIPKNINGNLNKKNAKNYESTEIEENMPSNELLQERISKRLAGFPHACNYCLCPADGPISHLIFKTSEELSQHFFDVHDPKLPYPCPKCPRLFSSMKNRNKHYETTHGSNASKHCKYCNKKLLATQEEHEKICKFIADWHCEVCKNDFIQMPLRSFRAHQRSHVEKRFRCETCQIDFPQLSLLVIHKRSHSKATDMLNKNDYYCMECNQEFGSMYELKSHEFNMHNGKVAFRCRYCTKGYSTVAFLMRHMENEHSDKMSEFGQDEVTCSKCNTTFQSKNKLYHHTQRTKYENGKCVPITCAEKSRPCDQCSKRFNSKEQLDLHKQMHDVRQRPYACKTCNVRCRTVTELKEHQKLAHFTGDAFKCKICGEKFAYNKDLQTHKLYHEKLTFKCTFGGCEENFTNEKLLKNHMRTHEKLACEYCGDLFTASEMEVHKNVSHINVENNNDMGALNYDSILRKSITDFNFNDTNIFDNHIDQLNFDHETEAAAAAIAAPLEFNQSANHLNVPYVGETMETNLIDNDIFNDHQAELLTHVNETLANNVDLFMSSENLNVNDSFISSLLDPDYEIIVN